MPKISSRNTSKFSPFGQRIYSFVEAAQYKSMSAFAADIGMAPANLQRYLLGEREPGLKILDRIAQTGCSVDYLLLGEPQKKFNNTEAGKLLSVVQSAQDFIKEVQKEINIGGFDKDIERYLTVNFENIKFRFFGQFVKARQAILNSINQSNNIHIRIVYEDVYFYLDKTELGRLYLDRLRLELKHIQFEINTHFVEGLVILQSIAEFIHRNMGIMIIDGKLGFILEHLPTIKNCLYHYEFFLEYLEAIAQKIVIDSVNEQETEEGTVKFMPTNVSKIDSLRLLASQIEKYKDALLIPIFRAISVYERIVGDFAQTSEYDKFSLLALSLQSTINKLFASQSDEITDNISLSFSPKEILILKEMIAAQQQKNSPSQVG